MIGMLLTVCFFLFPGLLLLGTNHTRFFPKLSPVEKLPMVIALSLAYWMVSFWFLKYLPIPLHIHIYTTLGISAILFVLLLIRGRVHIPHGTQNIAAGLCFLVLFLPALAVVLREVAPSWADMSMQAYIAKTIFLTNGFPETLEPIVPVAQFGTYPIGFPTLVASLMKINALPVTTNALWLSVFTYWFFAISIFVLLRAAFPIYISMMVTVIISWVSSTPHDFITWGANPTVLSFVFLIAALTSLLHCKGKAAAGFALLFFYSSWLTHYMLPVATGYLILLFAPFFWSSIKRHITSWKQFSFPVLMVFFCTLPWIVHVAQNLSGVSSSTMSFVAALQHDELSASPKEMIVMPIPIFTLLSDFYTHTFGVPILALYILSLIILLLVRPKSVLLHGIVITGISILILNALYWWLPLSYLLYPKRLALILLIPMAYAIAQALQHGIHIVYKHFIIHTTRNRMLLSGLTVLLLWLIYTPHIRVAIHAFTQQGYLYVVTPADITAMQWLNAHTTPTDIIQNNYWDAGLWIPAVADRKITHYHTNPFDMDILRKEGRATYAYVGKKTLTNPPGADPINRETLSNDPEHFTLVYDHDGVAIYKIIRGE